MAFFRPKLSATLPPTSEPGTQATDWEIENYLMYH
jgi:hypothetical protein